MSKKENDQMKSEFISVASHQLKAPLLSIVWLTDKLKEENLTKKQMDYIEDICRSCQIMKTLIEELLDVCRLENGMVSVEAEMLDFEKLIEELIVEFQPFVRQKGGCGIFFKRSKEESSKAFLDRFLIKQLIVNLLDNAVHYSKKGKCKIEVGLEKRKNGYLFSISDEGIGIPEADQGRVFEKFFRAENAKKKKAQGSGLGLYAGKIIVDNLGGDIWFKSKEDKGTTFFVFIPS